MMRKELEMQDHGGGLVFDANHALSNPRQCDRRYGDQLCGHDKIKEPKAMYRLATVVRDSNDAITVQDFRGNILAWNKAATAMYGFSEAEALKMNMREIVPPNKRKELAAITKKIKNDERQESFVTQRLCKNRKVLDVWLTFTGLKDESGRLVEIATTERDISELKKIRVQQAIRCFDLPVQELRRGYRSDIYFWREKITLEKHNLHPEVTMQVFQKKRPSCVVSMRSWPCSGWPPEGTRITARRTNCLIS